MLDTFSKVYALLDTRERVKGAILAFLMIGKSAFEVIGVGSIPIFVALVNDPEMAQANPQIGGIIAFLGIEAPDEFLVKGGIALVLVFVIKNIYLLALNYGQNRYINNRQVVIGVRLLKTYLDRPYTFHLQRNTAVLLRNVNQEVELLVHRVLSPGFTFFMEGLTFLLVIGLLFYVEPFISAVALGLLGASVYLFYRASRNMISRFGEQEQLQRGNMMQAVNEGLGGIKETKILGREQYFLQRFMASARSRSQAMQFNAVLGGAMRPFIEIMAIIGMLLVSVLLFLQGRAADAIIPVLTLFAVAIVRLMPSFNMMLSSVSSLRYYQYVADVVFQDISEVELSNGERRVEQRESSSPLSFQSQIELRNVRYNYPETDAQALRDVSFSIPKGSAVALVGPSGAGKTTIIDIILGLLTPAAGEVRVDGEDLFDHLKTWQRMIGYIPQQIYLTDDTIRRNIAFGVDEAEMDDEKVWRAVRAAQLEAFVNDLPEGLDSFVGEQGVRVSGGQRQRIAIARALYHDPEVLVMDEATAALDGETERNIIEALERLRGDRTIIMIAHRLSSVQDCDIIFHIKEGKVMESGTFEDLLDRSMDFRVLAGVED